MGGSPTRPYTPEAAATAPACGRYDRSWAQGGRSTCSSVSGAEAGPLEGRRRGCGGKPGRALVNAVCMIASAWGESSSRRAVAVAAHAEVDLGDGAPGRTLADMSIEQPEVDAVALDERHRLEHVAPAGVLARQRLHDAGQAREEQRDQRAGDELGRPPAGARACRRRAGRRSP